jgi:hypothetical protein
MSVDSMLLAEQLNEQKRQAKQEQQSAGVEDEQKENMNDQSQEGDDANQPQSSSSDLRETIRDKIRAKKFKPGKSQLAGKAQGAVKTAANVKKAASIIRILRIVMVVFTALDFLAPVIAIIIAAAIIYYNFPTTIKFLGSFFGDLATAIQYLAKLF